MLKRYRKSRPKGSSSVTMKGSDAIYLRLWSERDISGSVLTEISETDWCFRLSNSTHSQRGRHYKYNNWCHESLYLDKCWKRTRIYLNQRIFIAKQAVFSKANYIRHLQVTLITFTRNCQCMKKWIRDIDLSHLRFVNLYNLPSLRFRYFSSYQFFYSMATHFIHFYMSRHAMIS